MELLCLGFKLVYQRLVVLVSVLELRLSHLRLLKGTFGLVKCGRQVLDQTLYVELDLV